MKEQKENKLTAAQRLEQVEAQLANLTNVFSKQIQILADENDRNRSLIFSLSKRINAVITAAEKNSLHAEEVNKILLDDTVKELESKVQYLVNMGVLVLNNELEISNQSFVVGRDLNAEGEVINPRVQFAVGSLDENLKSKFISKKAGDLLDNEDGTAFEVQQVYEIVNPNTERNFEEEENSASTEQ